MSDEQIARQLQEEFDRQTAEELAKSPSKVCSSSSDHASSSSSSITTVDRFLPGLGISRGNHLNTTTNFLAALACAQDQESFNRAQFVLVKALKAEKNVKGPRHGRFASEFESLGVKEDPEQEGNEGKGKGKKQ